MQCYLHIGGGKDGQSFPVADDADFVQWAVGVADKETYARESLSVGDAFVDIFRHESLTLEQVLERLIYHYEAWCVNRPGGQLSSA